MKRQYFRYKKYIKWLLIDEILPYVFIYEGPSISFLRYEPLKNNVTIFDLFSGLKTHSRHLPMGGGDLLVFENDKLNCFDIQCVVENSSSSLNHNTTLESKENYPRHTKTVQNLLGFMPEVKALHNRVVIWCCALFEGSQKLPEYNFFSFCETFNQFQAS